MSGLLYKNFVAVKGRQVMWILVSLTALFLILRLRLPGGDILVLENGYVDQSVTDNDMLGFISDTGLACLLGGMELALFLVPISVWLGSLRKADEKNQTWKLMQVLPLPSNAYVVSWYLFFGIVYYVVLSVMEVWNMIFLANAGENILQETINLNASMLLIFLSAALLVLAIELPVFLLLGSKKGVMIKRLLLLLLLLAAFTYVLFGDLSVWSGFDLYALMHWLQKHMIWIVALESGMPVLALGVYAGSCFLTCRQYAKREVEVYD
ncbi:MAG: ABC-2 transporter permease [Clostridium sp.]|nr:ABC-2 transporter permease [Clostridium sp.]